jgi:hypothetical protein
LQDPGLQVGDQHGVVQPGVGDAVTVTARDSEPPWVEERLLI